VPGRRIGDQIANGVERRSIFGRRDHVAVLDEFAAGALVGVRCKAPAGVVEG